MISSEEIAADLNVVPGSIGASLLEGEQRLHYAGVIRPRRHTELLLEKVMGVDRTELYLRARDPISPEQSAHFRSLLARREAGEPVQYIVGWAPFYGRKFYIGEGVFIPRFETETVIERFLTALAEDRPAERPVEVLDLCCGSGVVGLTAAAEAPGVRVTLIDLSETAIECTNRNARELKVENCVEIIKRDALSDPPRRWRGRFRYILANPPYIPLAGLDDLPRDVRDGEPRHALTDRADGLSFYRRWMQTLPAIMIPHGRLIVECGDNTARSVMNILQASFKDVMATRDMNGMERAVEGILL